MAIDFIRNIISSGYNLVKINENFANIETSLQDGLSRSGNGPNQMTADIDLNSNDLLNVGTISATDFTIAGSSVTAAVQEAVDAAAAAAVSETNAANSASQADADVASIEAIAATLVSEQTSRAYAISSYHPITAPDFIRVAGYASAGDGGSALYEKVGSEPTHEGKLSITLDDAVTVVWYELAEGQYINIKCFGAVGDGVTDDGTAIQNWIDLVISSGTPGYAPKGKYLSNQQITGEFTAAASGPSNNKNTFGRCSLFGDGIDETIFYFPSTSGFDLLAKSFQQCFDLRDFTVTTGQADGGTAIYLRNQYAFFGSYTAQHDIQRITCRGDDGYGATYYWTKNLDLFNVTAVNIFACSLYGPSAGATASTYGIGIDLRTSTTPGVGTVTEPGAMTSINIKDTNIVFLGQGIIIDNYVQAVKIGHGTAILNGYDGIVVPAGGSEIRQISIIGVEISVNGVAISFKSAVSGSEIVGNHIAIAASKNGIELVTDTGASNGAGNIIASNDFNSKDGGTTGDAIYVNTSFNGVVIDNNNFNGILRAIELTANAQHVKVGAGNNYTNVTQRILDSSSARANRVHYSDDRGIVTQTTSKVTGVTLNKRCGTITTHNAALAAGAEATFILTNSRMATEAVLSLNVINPNYTVRAYSMANGSCGIGLKNVSAGSLSDAVDINFVLLPVD